MIKLTATALIHSISPIMDIPSKNGGQPFRKRELVLDDSWERDGERHSNFVSIEFTGDKICQLDNYQPGHRVTVEAYVNGRLYEGRIFNTLRGQSITFYQPRQTAPQQPQQPYAATSAAPAYPTQAMPGYAPGYAPAPAAPAPSQAPQYAQQPGTPGVADLPFPT